MHLNIEFIADEKEPLALRGDKLKMNFQVALEKHISEKRNFRITFCAKFSEHTHDSKLQGFQVDAKIVGFFQVSDDVSEEEAAGYAQLNSVNTLYGTLRGILLSATGPFPSGPMVLQSQTAYQILGIPAPQAPAKRTRKSPSEGGVTAENRVLGEILEKADPKAKERRR